MAIAQSPLRYPGGKQVLARILAHLMRANGAHGGTYIEPYAGGAGAAISLLFAEHVGQVLINDADPRIYSFWASVLNQTERFVKLILKTPTTVPEWERQRDVYQHPRQHSQLRVGFAAFFLNRCNRSGIIAGGGPIGGKHQNGKWKIDARFNREELARRVRRIGFYRDRISVSRQDGVEFLRTTVAELGPDARPFVYLDPPYYVKGRDLYFNHYAPEDHAQLAELLLGGVDFPWVLSYDNAPEIRTIYADLRQVTFDLEYSARERRRGREIMIMPPALIFPERWKSTIPRKYVRAAEDVTIPANG